METLLIERGYWRATDSSETVLACYNGDACLGGETGTSDFCSQGYEGPCRKRGRQCLNATFSRLLWPGGRIPWAEGVGVPEVVRM